MNLKPIKILVLQRKPETLLHDQLKKGTLNNILKQANVSLEEFLKER
jgi:hypothetical protein